MTNHMRPISPLQAIAVSPKAQLSDEDLVAIDQLIAGVNLALLDRFDGLVMNIKAEGSPAVIGEIARRFGAEGWSVSLKVTRERPRGPDGEPLIGVEPEFMLTLSPNWNDLRANGDYGRGAPLRAPAERMVG